METITRLIQGIWFYKTVAVLSRLYISAVYGLTLYDRDKVPPTGGLVIASNHISGMDPPLMGVAVPREVNYMAKKELYENRYLRTLILGLRTFPVDRERNDLGAIKESLRRLKGGTAVGIFFQGTRNTGEADAKSGAAYLAQRANVPLLPAAIWREGRAFRVRFGDPIMPQSKTREEMERLTEELMRQINSMIPPTATVPSIAVRQESL